MAPLTTDLSSAISELVQTGFEENQYDHVVSIFQKQHYTCSQKRQAAFSSAVRLFLDLAEKSYKPFSPRVRVFLKCQDAMANPRPSQQFVSHCLRNGANHFIRLCYLLHTCREDLEMALRIAAVRRLDDYVLWFFLQDPKMEDRPSFLINGLWTLEHEFLHLLQCCFTPGSWLARECASLYLRVTIANPLSWGSNLSELRCLYIPLENIVADRLTLGSLSDDVRSKMLAFVGHCQEVGEWSLALIVPLVYAEWRLVHNVLTAMPRDAKENFLLPIMHCVQRGMSYSDSLDIIIAAMEGSWTNTLAYDPSCFRPSKTRRLAEMCRGTRDQWMVFFMIQIRRWSWIKEFVSGSCDTAVTDMALVLAARKEKWDLVSQLLPRSSQTEEVATVVFKDALDGLRPEVVEQTLPLINVKCFEALLTNTCLDLNPDTCTEDVVWKDISFPEKTSFMHIFLLLLSQAIATNSTEGRQLLSRVIAIKVPAAARRLLQFGLVTLDECCIIDTRDEYSKSLDDRRVFEILGNYEEVKNTFRDCVRRLTAVE